MYHSLAEVVGEKSDFCLGLVYNFLVPYLFREVVLKMSVSLKKKNTKIMQVLLITFYLLIFFFLRLITLPANLMTYIFIIW